MNFEPRPSVTFAKFVHRCPNSASLPFPLDFLLFANAIFAIFINECFGRCRIIPLLLLLYLPKLPCDVLWGLFAFLILILALFAIVVIKFL